jgi:hypothetical protein
MLLLETATLFIYLSYPLAVALADGFAAWNS